MGGLGKASQKEQNIVFHGSVFSGPQSPDAKAPSESQHARRPLRRYQLSLSSSSVQSRGSQAPATGFQAIPAQACGPRRAVPAHPNVAQGRPLLVLLLSRMLVVGYCALLVTS